MPKEIFDFVGALAPTIGVLGTGWFGYMAARSSNVSNKQFKELKDDITDINKNVTDVKDTANKNNNDINAINEKLVIHGESHLITMRLRLERDITHALEHGHTTSKEYEMISRMHNQYKALGGNGYIDKLMERYQELELE